MMTLVLLIAGLVTLVVLFIAAAMQRALRNSAEEQQRLIGANIQRRTLPASLLP
jgi:hypothetical protein